MGWWGGFVHRHRWWVLVVSLLVFGASATVLSRGGTLNNNSTFHFESSQGVVLEAQQLPTSIANGFELVLGSPTLTVGSPAFASAVTAALAPLRRDSRVETMLLPPLDSVTAQSSLISGDRHWVAAEVELNLVDFASAVQVAQDGALLPASLRAQVVQLTGSSIAVLRAYTPYPDSSDQAANVVRFVRAHDQAPGAQVLVTGNTAFSMDYVQYMLDQTPWAVLYVMTTTFLLLMVLLRSLVLPLKAVVMNLLSLSAAFGALVFIFQQGHLSGLLDFSPEPLDPTIPVLIFCVVFGLSMDYEVFLLTRMREAWREHGDNRRAVASGLQASGRLVTGAAAIMVTVFLVFGLVSSVVVIKALGLGMAIAIFVDATLVRALVVPALMRLIGPVNWWAPRWRRQRTARAPSGPLS